MKDGIVISSHRGSLNVVDDSAGYAACLMRTATQAATRHRD